MSAFNSLTQQNACYRNIKWTFAGLLPRYCYAIKTNSRTILSQHSQPASAGKGGTRVNCKLITAWHCNCEPESCAVWVSYRQKTVIAKIKSINRNLWCRLQVFPEIFGSLMPISRGETGICPPCERPCDHWLLYIRFHKQGQFI